MRRIKRFLRDNQWPIMAIIGVLTWIALALEVFAGAMEIVNFYVAFARL